MTEQEMFEYAMLAWVALMIGTLLTVAWHLVNPAQGMSGFAQDPQGLDPEGTPARSGEVGCAQPNDIPHPNTPKRKG